VKLIVATYKLSRAGGSETYAVTIAEHLARLGHSVTLYARELGDMAELARERALHVCATAEELPSEADGVIAGVDRSLALELVARYPKATRLFVVHSSEDVYLPPPVPNAFAATIVLNDLHAARAAACPCTGEVVRLRQPVDLKRFDPRGRVGERPARVLLLGNYHSRPDERAGMLRQAWAGAGLTWREAGGAKQALDIPSEIAQVDVVVGFGRSALEAMACGRLAYIHDQAGSEGWVTPQSYSRIEAGGFAVAGVRLPPDIQQLRADLDAYQAEWGLAGRDIVRVHHDARDHAAALVSLLERLAPGRPCAEPSTLRALQQLAESQLRSELMAEYYRTEAKQLFALHHGSLDEIGHERLAWQAERESWATERATWGAEREHWETQRGARETDRDAWETARSRLEEERDSGTRQGIQAQERLDAFRRTRRYRLAQALAGPLDRIRGRIGR
jgi:hypothetical protein